MRRLLPAALALLALAGCARALREPRPLDEIAGGAPRPADRVGALLLRAEALYARRDLASVREAAGIWLEAAAADRTRVEGILGAVRARVWLADHETEAASRLAAAEAGVETVQWCGRIAPDDPACDYWLGVALGVQARERPSTALSALPRMIVAFDRAAAAAPALDHGGPDRALALLYVRAPGWPGPGDPEKGLEHARKAAALDPEHPPNLLALAEALEAAGGDEAEARSARSRALDMARARAVSGDPDAREWLQESEAP